MLRGFSADRQIVEGRAGHPPLDCAPSRATSLGLSMLPRSLLLPTAVYTCPARPCLPAMAPLRDASYLLCPFARLHSGLHPRRHKAYNPALASDFLPLARCGVRPFHPGYSYQPVARARPPAASFTPAGLALCLHCVSHPCRHKYRPQQRTPQALRQPFPTPPSPSLVRSSPCSLAGPAPASSRSPLLVLARLLRKKLCRLSNFNVFAQLRAMRPSRTCSPLSPVRLAGDVGIASCQLKKLTPSQVVPSQKGLCVQPKPSLRG